MKDRKETGNVVQRLIAAAAIFFLMAILHIPLWGEEVDRQEAPGPLFFTIKTDGALGDAIRHIEGAWGVAIVGLDGRFDEKISVSCEASSLKELLETVLRSVGEVNWACIYQDGVLKEVIILPRARPALSDATVEPEILPWPTPGGRAVSIVEVLPESQAARIGLQKGDLIVSYDGLAVEDVQTLVNEVKSRRTEDAFELIILREGKDHRFIVQGGLLGVRIMGIKIGEDQEKP